MTLIAAKQIAQTYVEDLGEIFPGFRYGIADEQEFWDRYYFDFVYLNMDGSCPTEPPLAGGAMGFTVHKLTGQIQVLTHSAYWDMVRQQDELDETYALLKNIKQNRNVTLLKARYNLSSKQLMFFLKNMENEDLSKENTFNILHKLIDQAKRTH